jgi:hypothetical protein
LSESASNTSQSLQCGKRRCANPRGAAVAPARGGSPRPGAPGPAGYGEGARRCQPPAPYKTCDLRRNDNLRSQRRCSNRRFEWAIGTGGPFSALHNGGFCNGSYA